MRKKGFPVFFKKTCTISGKIIEDETQMKRHSLEFISRIVFLIGEFTSHIVLYVRYPIKSGNCIRIFGLHFFFFFDR